MAELDDKVIVTKQKITDIADQIRAELSESDEYKLDVMPTKIHEVAQGGGGSAVINPLSVTQNGTYTATGNVDGYSPVTVAVEPDLEDITITQNGSYKSSQHDGYDDVIVNVTPVEPTTKVVSEFDFSQAEYDIIRSIVGSSASDTSLVYGAPYNATVSNNEMVFNNTGQAYFHPAYYLNELKNYEIEIEFGTVDNSGGGWELGGFKIYGQNFCVWLNYENNVLTAFNSSENFPIPNRTLADFSNKTIKFIVSHRISTLTNETLTEVSLLFEGETTPIKLGDVDNKLPYYPFIGSLSGNAIRTINIKSMKITESKWTPVANRELSKNSNDESEETNEKSVEKETIEEKTDEVKEQKKDSVEKSSELDA